MRYIGLTGGFGAGKSTVGGYFTELGATLLDADDYAREITAPDHPFLPLLKSLVGPKFFTPTGELDRRKLGRAMFGDEKFYHNINALFHPTILRLHRADLHKIAMDKPEAMVIFAVPLLFEAGWHAFTQWNLLVVCEREVAKKRLIEQRHYSPAEIAQRLKHQWPDARKQPLANYTIDNSGDKAETLRQVKVAFHHILSLPNFQFSFSIPH